MKRMLHLAAHSVLILAFCLPARSQSAPGQNGSGATSTSKARLQVKAMRLDAQSAGISVDGKLDEAQWALAPVINQFKQRDPHQGAEPTERTEVRVIYDDQALYIGARMFDSAPDSIVARLGRRDQSQNSDMFMFFVDPFLDRRTGYYFGITAAGTRLDGVLMNDDWDDEDWDGVWTGRASRDEQGWTAELCIPYSQIRFHKDDKYTWGVNFSRNISRKNERDYITYTPRSESGFVSRFSELVGIEEITPPRQIEIIPYATQRLSRTDFDTGDPYNDGTDFGTNLGLDFKVGITNNLVLNGAINPDFGQVEVDPAVVNLSDVETFFPEKRSFFIEGANIFRFGRGGANNNWGFNWGNPSLFYSRRIGRAPTGSLPDHDFSNRPDGTTILGAVKLSGKLGNAWNFGAVQSVTAREKTPITLNGTESMIDVEPLSYYGVVRAQREFNDSRQSLGFISTTTARSFTDDGAPLPLRDQLNGQAYAFGVDGYTFLDKNKTWVLTGWTAGTRISGTPDRLLDVQTSSQHYYQRPDAGHVSVDSLATSLSGYAGRFALNKQRGNWQTNATFGFISPGFDSNDLGFQWRTDHINSHALVGYRWSEPRGIRRHAQVNSAVIASFDFGGNHTGGGFFTNGWIQFSNYWSMFGGTFISPVTKSNRTTRGGPLMKSPSDVSFFTGIESDDRKQLTLGLDADVEFSKEAGDSQSIGTQIRWRPMPNMSLSVRPQVSLNTSMAQYVDVFDDPLATSTFGRRYIFGELDQTTFSSSIRMQWTFTPDMSLQLFAQPLISSGRYANLKELRAPGTYDFNVFGVDNGSTFDPETFIADPDGDGPAAPLSLSDNDFNFKSLRGTAVLRWEFRKGSTFFLVWTQSRDDFEEIGDFRFGKSFNRLIDAKPDNIFVVKLTYWLNR